MRTQDVEHLMREQLRLFLDLGDQLAIPPDDRRRLLLLSDDEWAAWSGHAGAGRLPSAPVPPLMLLRLATANHRIAAIAERREARRRDQDSARKPGSARHFFVPSAANVQEPPACR